MDKSFKTLVVYIIIFNSIYHYYNLPGGPGKPRDPCIPIPLSPFSPGSPKAHQKENIFKLRHRSDAFNCSGNI